MKHRRERSFASVLTSTSDRACRCSLALALELDGCERILLDALMKPKTVDPSLSFRRSCRETLGPDAVNIGGKTGIAC